MAVYAPLMAVYWSLKAVYAPLMAVYGWLRAVYWSLKAVYAPLMAVLVFVCAIVVATAEIVLDMCGSKYKSADRGDYSLTCQA